MDELLENATATADDEQEMSYIALEKNHKLLQGDYQVLEHNYSEALSQIDIYEQQLYSDVANFERAFRRWTNTTPLRYRDLL